MTAGALTSFLSFSSWRALCQGEGVQRVRTGWGIVQFQAQLPRQWQIYTTLPAAVGQTSSSQVHLETSAWVPAYQPAPYFMRYLKGESTQGCLSENDLSFINIKAYSSSSFFFCEKKSPPFSELDVFQITKDFVTCCWAASEDICLPLSKNSWKLADSKQWATDYNFPQELYGFTLLCM